MQKFKSNGASATQQMVPVDGRKTTMPFDHLTEPIPKGRVFIDAHMTSHNQLTIAATAHEQKYISLNVAQMITKNPKLSFTSVKTYRGRGANGNLAHTFAVVTQVDGGKESLLQCYQTMADTPYFDLSGYEIVPKKIVDLIIITHDRTGLMLNELELVSGEHDAMIETLVNDHHRPKGGPDTEASIKERNGVFYTGLMSVTGMRLEFDDMKKMARLKHDLTLKGRDQQWEVRWKEFPPRMPTFRPTTTPELN